MRIYGDTSVLDQEGRFGERTVYNTLKECFDGDEDWLAIYGLAVVQLTDRGLGDPNARQLAELDFLVINKKLGVLLIEVKGGQIRCREQVWEQGYQGRWEELERTPMQQAVDGLYALLARAAATPTVGSDTKLLLHAPLVAFPGIDRLEPLPAELSTGSIALRSTCASPREMEAWLSAAFNRLQAQHGMRFRGNAVTNLLDGLVMPVVTSTFGVRTLSRRLSAADNNAIIQPGRHDDFVRERELRRKVLVYGPAGSGKTIVGMIRAARLLQSSPSARVLVMTYNRLVSARTASIMSEAFGQRVESEAYHVFAQREVKRAGIQWREPENPADRAAFFRETAPELLSQACGKRTPSESEKFDLVVFDEAQDFNWLWIMSLEPYLKPDAIRWAMYDPQQFIFGSVASEPGDHESQRREMEANLVREFGDPDRLLKSYRMSRGIFEYLRARDLMPPGIDCDPLAYEGAAPITEEVTLAQAADAVRCAAAHAITTLGVPPQQVLVQTKHRFDNPKNPLAGQLGRFLDGRYRLVELPGPDEAAVDAVPCVTISRYKGCERAASIVIESPVMEDSDRSNLLYTALTRARLHLHVIRIKGS